MGSGEVGPGPEPIVLLVEDDVLIRFTIAEMLREEGYVVLEAVNASEALAMLATGQQIDIVLSDVRMPGKLDGIALTAEIKSVRPHLPVALVSSHLPVGVHHGADGFLAKPFRLSELLDLIGSLAGSEWRSGRSSLGAS